MRKTTQAVLVGLVALCAGAVEAQESGVCPPTFAAYRGSSDLLRCSCSADATRTGSVWGVDVYTDDSSICRAAVHAGAIDRSGGDVSVRGRPGQTSYRAGVRNGVQSESWKAWSWSFAFEGSPPGAPLGAGWEATPSSACPSKVDAWRGSDRVLTCRCTPTAAATGRVWGVDLYTDDSSVCRAAVHAGMLSPSGGRVSIRLLPGASSYGASTRNGVTTQRWGAWGGSFGFRALSRPQTPAQRDSPRAESPGPTASPPTPPSATPGGADGDGIRLGRYFGLVIGIDAYESLPKLQTAESDARAVARVLEQGYGFETRVLIDATRADILQALSRLRAELDPSDNLVIYYAGHGWLDQEADEGYWLPVDATRDSPVNWISNASITSALKAIRAKHVLVIADSCYSGKLTRGISRMQPTSGYLQRIASKRARVVLAAGGLEPVPDGGAGQHSIFAQALLRALEENQAILSGTELFNQIRRPIMVNSDQTPEYSDIRKAGHDGGDFLFARPKP